MIPIKPGASLSRLTDDQAQLAARVAEFAQNALGSSDPSMVAEVCAILIANTISEHGIRDFDAVEPLTLTLMNDVVQRVNALGLAHLAIVKAMAAAKKS